MGSPCSHRGPASSPASGAVVVAGVYALDDVKVLAPPPLLVVALPYAICCRCCMVARGREAHGVQYDEDGDTDSLLPSTSTTVNIHKMVKREPPRSQEFIESSGDDEREQQEQEKPAPPKKGKKGAKVRCGAEQRRGSHGSSSIEN